MGAHRSVSVAPATLHVEHPRARVKPRDAADEEAERVLETWADWYHLKAMAQGYGGGVDVHSQRLQRAPGVHADPVLSEYIAAEADDQGEPKRVHSIILGYTAWWKRVAKARWVGRIVVTATREMSARGPIEIAAGVTRTIVVTERVPLNPSAWRYTGLQTMETVAEQLGAPLRTVERTVAQIKRQLPLDVAAVQFSGRLQANR